VGQVLKAQQVVLAEQVEQAEQVLKAPQVVLVEQVLKAQQVVLVEQVGQVPQVLKAQQVVLAEQVGQVLKAQQVVLVYKEPPGPEHRSMQLIQPPIQIFILLEWLQQEVGKQQQYLLLFQ
jgi:hypothetical protein